MNCNKIAKGISAMVALVVGVSCGSMNGDFEGKWARTDSVGGLRMADTLTLRPGREFQQDITFSVGGQTKGSAGVKGEWGVKGGALTMEYDTVAPIWRGDSLMGTAFRDEFIKGLRLALANDNADPYGLADATVRGDSLIGVQGNKRIVYLRVKE